LALFDDDFTAVDDMLADAFFSTVEIHRGANSTAGVTAEAVSRDYELTDEEGIITIAHVRDYVIDVADYVIDSSIVAPRIGDRIKETIPATTGDVHVFEVMPLATRPCAEWSTTQKPQWLIHTKLVGTE